MDDVRHFKAMPLRRWFAEVSLSALLVPVLSGLCLVGCGGGGVDLAVAPTSRLASVDNFRDVAGPDDARGYRTSAGLKLRRGVIYRSNALAPDPADLATLNTLGILAVYDLRTPAEIAKKPDIMPTGAAYLNINIVGTSTTPTPSMASVENTIASMEGVYRDLVTDAGIRDRYAQLFTALAATGGAQVFHCTGGKDRTGWATAILQTIAGVPPEVILEDYMLTNRYSAGSIQASYDGVAAARGKDFADIYLPVLVVRESYLAAALDQAIASYGSMGNYITNGLGLDVATQTKLRGKLTGVKAP